MRYNSRITRLNVRMSLGANADSRGTN